MSVKIESVYSGPTTWLTSATFNNAAIIDAIQSVDETNAALEQAIYDYCSNLRRIMENMLGSASYRGEDADDEMIEEWVELTNVVEKLLDKIKN